jgi:hypothetical protein
MVEVFKPQTLADNYKSLRSSLCPGVKHLLAILLVGKDVPGKRRGLQHPLKGRQGLVISKCGLSISLVASPPYYG